MGAGCGEPPGRKGIFSWKGADGEESRWGSFIRVDHSLRDWGCRAFSVFFGGTGLGSQARVGRGAMVSVGQDVRVDIESAGQGTIVTTPPVRNRGHWAPTRSERSRGVPLLRRRMSQRATFTPDGPVQAEEERS